VWNDMNEPALFEIEGKTFPGDVRHDFDGRPCSHRKAHNIYGMQMARATYKGLKKFSKSKRPFVVTRSAYAGTQRYAATWTGDNIASWEHLWLATVQCQRLSVSGFSFVGTDVGGFIDHPTPELFIRWIQLAAFHPFFRNHSSGDHGDQEPWCFGEAALEIARKFINLRYTLMPYMYTAFYEYVQAGTPIIKPISWYDQQDTDTLYRADEFIVGNHILVCPVLEPNATSRYVYLPKGHWYHYWTGERLSGGREIQAPALLEEIPMYIRAGAVIPFYPVSQFVGEKPVDQLHLKVYLGEEELTSCLYEDAGEGYDYKNGIYNLKQFTTVKIKDEFRLTLKNQGHFETQYSTFRFELIGLSRAPSVVFLNEKPVDNPLALYNGKTLDVITGVTSFISLRIIE
jgi:alpha-glucosidase